MDANRQQLQEPVAYERIRQSGGVAKHVLQIYCSQPGNSMKPETVSAGRSARLVLPTRLPYTCAWCLLSFMKILLVEDEPKPRFNCVVFGVETHDVP